MTTIGNVGIGLFILIIVWILALIFFVVAVKAQSNLGWIVLGLATTLTLILILIPTEPRDKGSEENFVPLERDYTYIYRNLLLVFLITSALFGFICFFVLHCIEPIRVKSTIKTF